MDAEQRGRWPAQLVAGASSSFLDHVTATNPALLPFGHTLPAGELPAVPHGTTITALSFRGGVLMAGDRRATMGTLIANRHIEKVFPADHLSLLGIAGTAGLAIDLVRLFQVELEHYEKIEGTALSLEGKANRLGAMVRANLPMALQGLTVLPLFAGMDVGASHGKLFSYDVTGGRYEEREHHSIGSGAVFARGALKKLWQPELSREAAIGIALAALLDAADDDAATAGPDLVRRQWPVVYTVTTEGVRRVAAEELAEAVQQLLAQRSLEGREA